MYNALSARMAGPFDMEDSLAYDEEEIARFIHGGPHPGMPGEGAMKFLGVLLLLMAAAAPAMAWDTYVGRNLDAEVLNVPAGNVVNVRQDNGKEISIAFYGVGIPTMRQPMGREAHALLARLLPKGTKVTLTTVNEGEDGLVSALVQVADHSVNNRLISEGLAWVDRSTCKAFFCRRWHIEEHTAQMERKGIWALNISTPPWQWGEVKEKK